MMVPVSRLKMGVSRPQAWIDKHPEHTEYQKFLLENIPKEGLHKALEIDRKFVVQVGNQRLEALRKLGWKFAPCDMKG